SIRMMAKGGRADGFIVLYSKKEDQVIDYLHQENLHYAIIGKPYQYENEILYVDNDNQLAGKDAANYLIGLNHQKIAYVCSDIDEMVTAERLSGYQQALAAANIAIDPTYIVAESFQDTENKQQLASLFLADEH